MDMAFDFAQESKKLENLKDSKNFSSCDAGDFNSLKDYVMENKDINLKIPSKLFLHKVLNLTGSEISLTTIPAGTDYSGKHTHKENEEVIIVLSGSGCVLAGNDEIPVKTGSIVRIGTGCARAVKSSAEESLTYICIQTRENSLTNYTLTDAQML